MQLPILDWRLVAAVTLLVASFSVSADTRVNTVWRCTLNEDKTAEDLNAVHGKWVAWAKKQSYGGDIRGYIGSPMISNHLDVVWLIESFPDLATYAADDEAFYNSEEGQALADEYDAVSTCTSSSIHSVTESGSD